MGCMGSATAQFGQQREGLHGTAAWWGLVTGSGRSMACYLLGGGGWHIGQAVQGQLPLPIGPTSALGLTPGIKLCLIHIKWP